MSYFVKVSFLNAGTVQQYLMYPLRGEWLTFKSEVGFDWIKKFPLESKLLPGRHYKFSLQLTAQLVFLEVSSKKWRKYGLCHVHYSDNHSLIVVPFWTNTHFEKKKKFTIFCIFALFLIWKLSSVVLISHKILVPWVRDYLMFCWNFLEEANSCWAHHRQRNFVKSKQTKQSMKILWRLLITTPF